jgi:predicted transcriptional regulator
VPDDNSSNQLDLVAEIVAAYVGRNQTAADQLPILIATVHQSLSRLGEPAPEVVELVPAVSARRSVHRDYVTCMDCGYRGQMLKRHLTAVHGLTVEGYRARWNLPSDHVITALGYSERRSVEAKKIGLGRSQAAPADTMTPAEPETATHPTPKRRSRPRSAAE